MNSKSMKAAPSADLSVSSFKVLLLKSQEFWYLSGPEEFLYYVTSPRPRDFLVPDLALTVIYSKWLLRGTR